MTGFFASSRVREQGGVEITSVSKGGPAEKAGVKEGDILFRLDAAAEEAELARSAAAIGTAKAQLDNLLSGKRPDEQDVTRAQRREAEANLLLARQEYDRAKMLTLTGTAAKQRLDQAQAAVAQAQWRLDQKSVKSPASGLVQDTLFVVGEWVPAGSPVVSLLPPANIKVRFFIPEPQLAQFKIGQALQIGCDGCAKIQAQLSYIASQAEYTPPVIYSNEARAKLVYRAEARLAPEDAVKLHPGQPVDIVIP